MTNSFRLEACWLTYSNDHLQNELWLNVSKPGIYVVYDNYLPKIIDLFNANVGFVSPFVGNIVYGDKIFWKLSEQERADLINHEISVLSWQQLHDLSNLTTIKILQNEIAISEKSLLKHRWIANSYIKEKGLLQYKKTKFIDLPNDIKNEVILAKLLYKKPKYVHIDFLNQPDKLLSFCEIAQKDEVAKQVMIFAYSNHESKLANITNINLGIEEHDRAKMIYTVQPIKKINLFYEMFESYKFFVSLYQLFKTSLWFFWTWVLSSFVLIMLAGFVSVFDFKKTFNIDVSYDINGLIVTLSLMAYCIYFASLSIWFANLYTRFDKKMKDLIMSGINRMILFNSYLIVVLCALLAFGTLSIVVNIWIIPLVLDVSVYQVNIIWPIILYALLFCSALLFHYRYIFKMYKINLPNLSLF